MPNKTIKSRAPSILVVIATLGQRNDLLKDTLRSIVTQKISNLDIVLIYPKSNKETKQIARQYKAVSLDDPGSMSGAVNDGIIYGMKTHTYVTWIGDDDLLLPGSLSSTIAELENHPKAVAAYGYCEYINQNGTHLFTNKAGILARWILSWGPDLIPLPGTVFRMSILKKLDYTFDVSLKYAMDLDLFLRLKKVGELRSVQRPVSCFRWHSTSATVSNRQASLKESEMVKRRYLSKPLRIIAPLWEMPVRVATTLAAKRVNESAASKAAQLN